MTSNLSLFPLMNSCFEEAQKSAERKIAAGESSELAHRYAFASYIGMLEGAISMLVRNDDTLHVTAYSELSDILTRLQKTG